MFGDRSRPNPVWADARDQLTHFVMVEASAMAQLVGFGWRADPQAPADYGSLYAAYVRSRLDQRPLPVSDKHTDTTIYATAEANLAYRFWHDVTHVRLQRGFDHADEVKVAQAQLDILEAKGIGKGTLEYWLFERDTLGQTMCGAAIGAFPKDQACFVRTSLEVDLTRAIHREFEANLWRE